MTLADSSQPSFRRAVFHLLSGSLLGRAFGFLLNLMLSRLLGPSGLGLFNLVQTTAQTFELTARLGVDYGLSCALTGPGADSLERQQILVFSGLRLVQLHACLLSVFLWIWTFVFSGLFPVVLPVDRGVAIASLILISISEALAGLPWDLFLISGNTRLVALRPALFAPLKLLGATLGAWFWGALGALVAYVFISGVQALWLQWRCLPLLPSSRHWHPNWTAAFSLVKMGLPLFASNAVASVIFLPLLAGVARTHGIAEVGYLRVGQIIVQIFTLLPGALAPLLFLRLRRSAQAPQAAYESELSLRLIWCLGLCSLFFYMAVDNSLVSYFFGVKFLPALQPTRLLVLVAVLESVGQVLHTPLLAARRSFLYAFGQNIPAIAAAVVGWIFIPRMGLDGLLLAKLLCAIGPVVIYLGEAWPRYQSQASVARLAVVTLAIAPLCWFPHSAGVWVQFALGFVLLLLACEVWALRQGLLSMVPQRLMRLGDPR